MKQKLTKAQKETLEALKGSRFGSLEVGPGCVEVRTADALVRKGYCEWGTDQSWPGKPVVRTIRLLDAANK